MSVTASVKGRRRRTGVVSAAVLAVIALVITGFAMRYPGLSSSEVEVSNGGVWVLNKGDGLMGRLNVDAQELDARLSMAGEDLDVVQSGYTVIETGSRGMTPINTASIQRGGMVELRQGTEVALGGDRVAIAAPDGRVWILSPEEAAAFSPSSVDPVHETGSAQPAVSVSSEGTVFVLDGTSLTVFPRAADTRETEASETTEVPGVSTAEDMVELTAVGEVPVILDRENRLLRLGLEATDYSLTDDGVSDLDNAQLQQPSPASENVVLATADTLFTIPLDGGEARAHPAGGTGAPVEPAQAKGCAYGAWNGSKRYVSACGEGQATDGPVPEAGDGGDLRLRVNHDLVVLNDQEFGLSWMITDAMQIVDDWVIEEEIQTSDATEEEKETLTTTITNIAAERDEENRPPVANDDEFGVRPGKSVVLPVTRNDTDPDGDLLTVTVHGDQPGIGNVTPIQGGRELQIDVDEDASGSAEFTYEVDDGRGGSDTATVTLEVRGQEENAEPQPAEQTMTKVQVRSGEEVSLNILPYWEDPDGDAFYLANATTEPEDLVSFRADGHITFDDAGLATGTKRVELTFRDERGKTAEGVLEVESVADSDLEPITTADHASIVAGRSTTIKPLANDINPNGGQLELTHVSEQDGLTVDPALEAGTVNLSGDVPGTYYLNYTVAASGASTSSDGLIRVDVTEPDAEDLLPVAVDDMGTVTTGNETLIDPLENDVDPTGGVLVVNSVEVPEGSGLTATVVGHHLIKVEAGPNAVLGEEPVALTYEVANSEGSTTGTVRMMVARTDTQFANPVAVPDQAVVRAGDMVLVDVIANDVSPSGATLNLGGITGSDSADARGHVEPHQDQIRFTADDDASGEAVVTYEVVDETGRSGSARLTITVVPRDGTNAPPRPENLTARTVAGTPVRIPVPTTGIDPDGDSVMLTGIASPTPELGEVTKATGEWIEYVPHEDSVGTDRFRYQVMDRNGAVGMGEVLVGIAQPNAVNQPPYAVDDIVEVRPDREVQIPVLDNDTDPEGAPLHVVREDVEAMTEIEVDDGEDQTDGMVTVTTPSEPGTHTVLYSASDGQLKDSATITIKVDPNAPLRAPIARDDFVEAADVLDPEVEHVDVEVLANDSDPDGSVADLEVSLDEAHEGAQVLDDKSIRITPQDEQQQIRYIIEDLDGLTSAGYIWVPGRAKQAPVWVGGVVEVQAGSETTVDLADPNNVRVRPGTQNASVTDPALVTAARTDGTEIVQDATTLLYRAAEGTSGEDTISVEVTDGETGDATAATATLAIPVRIAPEEENLPPTLQGAVLEVEQGGAQGSVDLAASAEDPEGEELAFSLGEFTEDPEVSIGLDGSNVTAQATARAPKGTIIDVPVSVTDGTNDPVTATVQVTVGSSNRPLISAGLDEAEIDAGETGTIPVLDNDSNPFPGGERRVFDPTLTNGDGSVSLDGDDVVISPAEDFHGILTAQYMVEDDTQDPDRHVSGEIRVTVRGMPDAPSAPRIGEVGDGFVELNFAAGPDNGAPITGYTVSTASGPRVDQECASTSCTITGLQNDTEYSFQVTAHNDVGESDPSVASATARPDVRPETPSAPSAERGDTRLNVSWAAPTNRGSAIQTYEVQMQNASTGALSLEEVPAGSTEFVWEGLTNGTDYRYRVRAHNLAEQPSDWSGWSQSEHPAGHPGKPSGTMEASRVNNAKGGGVQVEWPAMTTEEENGEPIQSYIITASNGGGSATVGADRRSHIFEGLDPDTSYTFSYIGVNSVGEGVAASDPSNDVVPWAEPLPPTSVSASMPSEGEGSGPNGRAQVTWSGATGEGTTIKDYVVRWDGGSEVVTGNSLDVTGLTNGKSYTFTVQSRNRFEGGESAISDASNSVTPYTNPDEPRITTSKGNCTGGDACPVTMSAETGSSTGGAGAQSLEVWVDGNKQNVSGGSFSTTLSASSGDTHTIRARAVNSEGLTSSEADDEVTARTYTPPIPQSRVSWHGRANNNVCQSEYCQLVDIEATDLEPGREYRMQFVTEAPTPGCTPTRSGPVDWIQTPSFTAPADGAWGTLSDGGHRYLYGYPCNDFTVYVTDLETGKETTTGTYPHGG